MQTNKTDITKGTGKTSLQRSNLLSQYLAEVRRYPLLSPEEEHKLAVAYHVDGDEEAGKKLVTSNLRLVVKMAYKFHSQWANVLDLIQQGNIGIMQALNKYDPFNETRTRFSSYAAYWIRSCIYNYIKDNYRIVRLGSTRHGRKLFDNLRKERERLQQLGITPTTKAISDSMDIPEEEIVIFSQHFSSPTLSFDGPGTFGEGRALNEVVSGKGETPEEIASQNEVASLVQIKLEEFSKTLTKVRDIDIWNLRLLASDPISLQALGDKYGVSKERIRQLESKIKIQLKQYLEQEMGTDIAFEFMNK
jgi:RNA polymerase sigma-32 factor